MKRTGEIVLGVIGLLLFGFTALLSILLITLVFNDPLAVAEIAKMLKQDDPQISDAEIQTIINITTGYLWIVFIASTIMVILGILAIILLIGNKKPKASGIILIISGGLGFLFTIPLGLLSGPFYVTAGIMCLVRKPKRSLEETTKEGSRRSELSSIEQSDGSVEDSTKKSKTL